MRNHLNTTTKKIQRKSKKTVRKHKKNLYKHQFGGDLNCTETLGAGFSAVIFLCERDGTKYAGKFANKTRSDDFTNELAIYNELYDGEHGDGVSPNILKYYKVDETEKKTFSEGVQDKINTNQVILLEYCVFDLLYLIQKQQDLKPNPTDVNWLLGALPTVLTFTDAEKNNLYWYVGKQVFNGLYYLFERQIVHFDIKPENIFVCKQSGYDILKIGDFGFAKKLTDITKLNQGTMVHMPPASTKTFNTHFFRDLYAYITLLVAFTEGEHYNNPKTPKIRQNLSLLFENSKYTNMNTAFYDVIKIVCAFEAKILLLEHKKYFAHSPEILGEYKTVYDAIKLFFENPKVDISWIPVVPVPVAACAKNKNAPISKCPDKQQSSENKLAEPKKGFAKEFYDAYNCCYYTVWINEQQSNT